MVTSRSKKEEPERPRRPPATSIEGVESRMISLTVELAEKQLRDGTASSQVMTHFLKLATTREKLEQEKLARENELLRNKSEAMASGKRMEELYENAIRAMRGYQGIEEEGPEFDEV